MTAPTEPPPIGTTVGVVDGTGALQYTGIVTDTINEPVVLVDDGSGGLVDYVPLSRIRIRQSITVTLPADWKRRLRALSTDREQIDLIESWVQSGGSN